MRQARFQIPMGAKARRLWRVLRATPVQEVAVDAVLGLEVPTGSLAGAAGGFDEVERRLSLGVDALLNAVDAYRAGRSGGGS